MTDRIQAVPTTYRGVEMRSKLEVSVAKCLDSAGFYFWRYEPERFDFELDGGRWSYLPDFYVDGMHGYVEVKPSIDAFDLNRVFAFIKKYNHTDNLMWIAVPHFPHSYQFIDFHVVYPDGTCEYSHQGYIKRRLDAEGEILRYRQKFIRDLVNSRSLDHRAVGEVLLAESHDREPFHFYLEYALKSPVLPKIDFRYFPESALAARTQSSNQP